MAYSVLTKVTTEEIAGKKFYLYIGFEDGLSTLSKNDADKLSDILKEYPETFSEIEVVPREDEEIKYLDIEDEQSEEKALHMENVAEYCEGILDKLSDAFDDAIIGIDRDETVKQTFKNE